jgi:threonine dehydratase
VATADRSRGAQPGPEAVTLEAIRQAADVIRGAVVRTPLMPFGEPDPGDLAGRTRVWLKPESLQPIGAFKLRGAYYNVATLSAEQRAAGVVAHSSGNHAQGVARAARLLGVRAVIVMPSDAPAVKVERVRADGAEIVFVGPATIIGQGTVGLEIVEQLAEIDGPLGTANPRDQAGAARPEPFTVLVPVGGGGIAAGVSVAVKSLRPDATVLGVEPALAADGRDSLAQGQVVTWPSEMVNRTIADGQRTAHIGQIPFAIFRRYLDAILTVSEEEIARAMVRGAREARLVLEPSGATTLAAWLFHRGELPALGRVVCILSGGNVDPARYEQLIAQGVAAGG